LVVDGTGAPARPADVAVASGRVAAIAAPGSLAARDHAAVIDAGGLVVSPGFVDLHTHLDAQVFWDPACSPSSLHGVTTIIGGNCGFTLAPLVADQTEYLLTMLAAVEGMPVESLRTGVPWDWTSFDEYLGAVERVRPAVNAGFLVGHSTLRRVVMGERAMGEPTTAGDLEAMEQLLDESLRAGGLGFSSSWTPTHVDGNGDPVPSRFASAAELIRLSAVCARHAGTTVEFIPGLSSIPFTAEQVDLMADMSLAAQRPLNWNILTVDDGARDLLDHQLAASDAAAARGAELLALALPDVMWVRPSFVTGMVLDLLPGWAETMRLPLGERRAAFADPQRRAALARASAGDRGLALLESWQVAETFSEASRPAEGRRLGEWAAAQGTTAFDALCDLAVHDDLRTVFLRPVAPDDDRSWRLRAEVWRNPRVVLGASDTGAHLDLMATFNYTTSMLAATRDRGLMALEEAVHRLTDVQARLYGLRGRGRIEPGAWADLVVFDPTTVGPGPVRTRHDLPAGAERLYGEAVGIEHVLVNGVEIVRSSTITGRRGGTVLRSGTDTDTVTLAANAGSGSGRSAPVE
jgi:N-acyl-D-aspartate/D-glutamate deacylase